MSFQVRSGGSTYASAPFRMNLSSRPTSITASTAYSRARAVIEIQASVVETLGEAASAVCIRPNTTHGWRPISVNTQPTPLPSRAHNGASTTIQLYQGQVGVRRLRVIQASSTAPATPATPSPIIQRNDQYVTGMIGL